MSYLISRIISELSIVSAVSLRPPEKLIPSTPPSMRLESIALCHVFHSLSCRFYSCNSDVDTEDVALKMFTVVDSMKNVDGSPFTTDFFDIQEHILRKWLYRPKKMLS